MVDTQTLNLVLKWARSIRVFSTLMTKLTILVSLHCILLHYMLVACLWLLWKVTGCWVNGTRSRHACSRSLKATGSLVDSTCSSCCKRMGCLVNCACLGAACSRRCKKLENFVGKSWKVCCACYNWIPNKCYRFDTINL